MRESVKIFAKKMEERLAEHDPKYLGDGWLADLEKRCLDIANYAMMIMDRIRRKEEACCER